MLLLSNFDYFGNPFEEENETMKRRRTSLKEWRYSCCDREDVEGAETGDFTKKKEQTI